MGFAHAMDSTIRLKYLNERDVVLKVIEGVENLLLILACQGVCLRQVLRWERQKRW